VARKVHYRITTDHKGGIAEPTACGAFEFNTLDLDAVTCGLCRVTNDYKRAHQRHQEVVDALAYPKEDHPCLTPHQRRR
jgi:hypothetical protein